MKINIVSRDKDIMRLHKTIDVRPHFRIANSQAWNPFVKKDVEFFSMISTQSNQDDQGMSTHIDIRRTTKALQIDYSKRKA